MATLNLPVFASNLDHRYSIVLDGETFILEYHYNARADRWTMHVLDVTSSPVRHGVRLVVLDDLLRRVALASKPAGQLAIVDPSGNDTEPSASTFGAEALLRYVEA